MMGRVTELQIRSVAASDKMKGVRYSFWKDRVLKKTAMTSKLSTAPKVACNVAVTPAKTDSA